MRPLEIAVAVVLLPYVLHLLSPSQGDRLVFSLLPLIAALLVLLSQKVAREARPDSGKGRDSDISRWGLIWISEQQTTVNRDLRGMSRGL
jgi:hypothetical protein